MQELKLS